MIRMTIGIALAGTFLSAATAFAQSAPSALPANQQPANQSTQVASNTLSTALGDGHLVTPYSEPVPGKTRAQVYRELIHAEQDGQLAHLNSTVYAHP